MLVIIITLDYNLLTLVTHEQLPKSFLIIFRFFPHSLSHLWCSQSKNTAQEIAYKVLIMQYYFQVLDSICLAYCLIHLHRHLIHLIWP